MLFWCVLCDDPWLSRWASIVCTMIRCSLSQSIQVFRMKEDAYSLSIRCLNPLRYGHSRGNCCGSENASLCSNTHSYSLCDDMSEDIDYIMSLLDVLAKENNTTHLVDEAKECFSEKFQDARKEAEELLRGLKSNASKKASKKKQTENSRTRLKFGDTESPLCKKLEDLCGEEFSQVNMTYANKVMTAVGYPKYGVESLRFRQHYENSPSNRKNKNDNDKEGKQSNAILNHPGSNTPFHSRNEVFDYFDFNKEATQTGVFYGYPESPNPLHPRIALPSNRYDSQKLLQSAKNESASPIYDETLPFPLASFATNHSQDSLLSLQGFSPLQNENENTGFGTVEDSGIESNEIAYE